MAGCSTAAVSTSDIEPHINIVTPVSIAIGGVAIGLFGGTATGGNALAGTNLFAFSCNPLKCNKKPPPSGIPARAAPGAAGFLHALLPAHQVPAARQGLDQSPLGVSTLVGQVAHRPRLRNDPGSA